MDKRLNRLGRFHCQEIGGTRSGIIDIHEHSVELYFVGYGDHVHIPPEETIHVVQETGMVTSLHFNAMGRLSTKSVSDRIFPQSREDHRLLYQSGIFSNLTLLGSEAWGADEKVKRISFDADGTKRVMRHTQKVRALNQSLISGTRDSILFSLDIDGMTLHSGYVGEYDFSTEGVSSYRPNYLIEFHQGCDLRNVRREISKYLSFLSFTVGACLSPSNVRLSRLLITEIDRALKTGDYSGESDVLWNWPAEDHSGQRLAFHGAPFLAVDDDELASLVAGLREWVKRADKWGAVYSCLTDSLSYSQEISGNRLLAACRWFEELPNAGTTRTGDEATIHAMVSAATRAAQCKGLFGIESRIRGGLRRIGEETTRARMSRLVSTCADHFDAGNLLDGMVEQLVEVPGFRGRTAHGHFVPQDEVEWRRFNKTTLALESLCVLLTALELPMTKEGRSRILSYPILEEYRLAYER